MTTKMTAALKLEKVNKSFGKEQVLFDVGFSVNKGEFCVFVGPSGCGKSTLIRIISGLEPPSNGKIYIDDKDVTRISAVDRGLAMVFQSYALYPHMTVRQNMSFGLENLRTPTSEINQRVNDAADLLQIGSLLHRKPGQLSGGQRQRVAIGRAIVRKPKIFLFDEPLSNLDAALRVQMRNELIALHRQLGNTMIYVTHDQVEAMTMASRVVVLKKGRVQQIAPPLELYNSPRNQFVAGFIGSPKMNFLNVAYSEGKVVIEGIASPKLQKNVGLKKFLQDQSSSGNNFVLGIRPEDISIVERGGYPCTVSYVEQLGGFSYIHGKVGNASVTIYQRGQFSFLENKPLLLSFNSDSCHWFAKNKDG